MNRKPLLFYLMLKQGIMWFTLEAGMQETVQTGLKCTISKTLQNLDNTVYFPDGMHTTTRVQLSSWILQMSFTNGNSGC